MDSKEIAIQKALLDLLEESKNDILEIQKQKLFIVDELEKWAEHFRCNDNEYEDCEEYYKKNFGLDEIRKFAPQYYEDILINYNKKKICGYCYISILAEKLQKGKCSEKDYEDILFHIWQINYLGEYNDEHEDTIIKGFSHLSYPRYAIVDEEFINLEHEKTKMYLNNLG